MNFYIGKWAIDLKVEFSLENWLIGLSYMKDSRGLFPEYSHIWVQFGLGPFVVGGEIYED